MRSARLACAPIALRKPASRWRVLSSGSGGSTLNVSWAVLGDDDSKIKVAAHNSPDRITTYFAALWNDGKMPLGATEGLS